MQRVSRWMVWLTVAMLLSLVAPVLLPAAPVFASPRQQDEAPAINGLPDDEIIVLEEGGRIRVDDPHQEPGISPVVWNSGGDTGWQNVATGDFNGDGDAEIVAVKGSTLKVYDVVTQPGQPVVTFSASRATDRPFRMLATGDFDGDGRDEIATTAEVPSRPEETLLVYDGGSQGASGQWGLWREYTLDTSIGDWTTANLNGDASDELIMVLGPMIDIWWGPQLLDSGKQRLNYNFPWITLAAGNLSSVDNGEELALTRADVGTTYDSIIFFRYTGGSFADLTGGFKTVPSFTSVAAGDVNGDNDDEVIFLRDPLVDKAALLLTNPSGGSVPGFEASIGFNNNAWNYVRMGDFDADGRDEIVVQRTDRYRVYEDALNNPPYAAWADVVTPMDRRAFAVANVDTGPFTNPILTVSPTSVALQGDYGRVLQATARVANAGRSVPMNWTATVQPDGGTWLKVNGAGSTSGVAPANVTISADTVAANHIGTIIGTVRFTASAPGWAGQTVDVRVTLTTLDPGFIVSPMTLFFMLSQNSGTHSQTIKLMKPSPGAVNWTATALGDPAVAPLLEMLTLGEAQVTEQGPEGAGLMAPPPTWLTLTPDQGTLQGEQTVTVTVNTAGLTPGQRTATILVRATGGTLPEPVNRLITLRYIVATEVTTQYMPLLLR